MTDFAEEPLEERLISRRGRPAIEPVALLGREIRAARRNEAKLGRRLQAAVNAGEMHRARRLQETYLRSRSAKLVALLDTNHRLPVAERWSQDDRLLALALQLSPWREPAEPVQLLALRKMRGMPP